MCGIVGLFLKDALLEPQLGRLVQTMLATMCERGPDSAGFAIYGAAAAGMTKLTLQSATPDKDFAGLAADLSLAAGGECELSIRSTHAVLQVPDGSLDSVRCKLKSKHPGIRVMSAGDCIEIYKEVGNPTEVAARFDLGSMTGSHAVGHTRMATESAVTTPGVCAICRAPPTSRSTARSAPRGSRPGRATSASSCSAARPTSSPGPATSTSVRRRRSCGSSPGRATSGSTTPTTRPPSRPARATPWSGRCGCVR